MMYPQKQVTVKLFYNRGDGIFYIQIGDDSLFRIRDTIAARIMEKERIEIRHAEDIKSIQLASQNDETEVSFRQKVFDVMPPMQEIGAALGLKMGESIHDKILPAIIEMKNKINKYEK